MKRVAVNDYGDDYGLRVKLVPPSTVVVDRKDCCQF